MRKFIDLFQSKKLFEGNILRELEAKSLEEKYSENNIALRDYLKQGDKFDPYEFWYRVCEWLESNDHLDEVSEILGEDVGSSEDLQEHDPEVFFELPSSIQKECADDVIQEVMAEDPASAPTTAYMNLRNKKLLPRNTWLTHFTDHASEIIQHGFTKGVDQMDKLGLTLFVGDDMKKCGGYNFAFEALSRDARMVARDVGHNRKYGSDVILFQNSGVHAYHYGDEEEQIIFWGKDVDPRDLVWLRNEHGEWVVVSRIDLPNGKDVLYRTDSYESAVKWVTNHHQQYRKYLYGR